MDTLFMYFYISDFVLLSGRRCFMNWHPLEIIYVWCLGLRCFSFEA